MGYRHLRLYQAKWSQIAYTKLLDGLSICRLTTIILEKSVIWICILRFFGSYYIIKTNNPHTV